MRAAEPFTGDRIMRAKTSSRSFGLLGALLLAAPALLGGCAQFPAPTGAARPAPTAEISQVVPGVDPAATRLQVVRRNFGGGYAMFEFNRAVDPTRLDLARTRLMTVRDGADGKLQVIEAAGDAFLDESGRVLSIELAETPRAGEVYRALTVADVAMPGGDAEELELGDVVVRELPAAGADLAHAMYVAPKLIPLPIDKIDVPIVPAPTSLTLASSTPDDGAINVDRDLLRVTIKYGGSTIDCAHPITGKAGFHLYSVDPALPASRQQNMYPDMVVGWGPTPKLVCDAARNQISMDLPGYLLGGTVFKVETTARATDGTTLSAITTFRTKNPGLQIYMTKATNEIYKCDTHYPFSDSFKCDIYLMADVKTRVSPTEAWQVNSKIPASGDWSDWSEDTSKTFYPPNQITLYQDATPVGDPVGVEIQAFDADTGDGWKKALSFLGGLGKVASPFWPPAGVIGEGLTQVSNALPADDDDFEGGGTYFLPKTGRWGTVTGQHVFKLPGRPATSQIVVEFSVYEYPEPWYAPAIIG
jgi:hypothetical protein